jgi:hypothetical protein
MANKPKNQQVKDQDTADKDGDNTPIDTAQRHTGIQKKGRGKEEGQPEGGTNAGPEGAPNQGTEKR